MLLHEKFDMFERNCRKKFEEMLECLEVTKCACWLLPWPELPDQENCVCRWPLLHKHVREWEERNTFRGVIMGSLSADPLKPSLRSATAMNQQIELTGNEEIIKSVIKRMEDVTEYLHLGLGEVYDNKDREVVEKLRTVLSLDRVIMLTKEMSVAVVMQREVSKFIEASQFIDEDFDIKYDITEMRMQYHDFLEKIADIGKQKKSSELSSLEIMVIMMNTEEKTWKGCEAVLDILCKAATMKSVESVVESWVSVLEHHSSKSRPLKDSTIHDEMMISINGPLLQHSQNIVEETIRQYWGKLRTGLMTGHFTRRSEDIRLLRVQTSKVVDGLNKCVIKTPFISKK
jgi:hypothetical protein